LPPTLIRMTSPSATKEDGAFPDGTKDYIPLRSTNKQNTAPKTHIADTPITWKNWHQHVNWLNTTFIIFLPLTGMVYSYWVPLHLYTAIWAVVYYFNTGLGITAGKFSPKLSIFSEFRDIGLITWPSGRLPPSLGPLLLQGHTSSQDLPCRCRCRRRPGVHPMVVL
jgi:stearoyl-CoA desaturase (delta-9 desaturase)